MGLLSKQQSMCLAGEMGCVLETREAVLKFVQADPGKVCGFIHAAVHCRRLE